MFAARLDDLYAATAHPDLLKERVILVTGASRGIGRVAALTFARHGATVILHGRDVERLEAVYDEIEAAGGPQPIILPLDLAKAASATSTTWRRPSRASSGAWTASCTALRTSTQLGPLQNERLTQWLELLRVNLAAPFALTQACAHLLRASPDASVILTAETHALQPAAYWGGFAVSKSGPARAEHDSGAGVGAAAQPAHQRRGARQGELAVACTHASGRDAPTRRATPESLMPLYLYLMGPDSRGQCRADRSFDCCHRPRMHRDDARQFDH